MSRSPFLLAGLLVTWLTASTPLLAAQHRATHLGNPATRFATPLKTPQDLRAMLSSEKLRADVAFIAKESGFAGSLQDLLLAATNAVIVPIKIPVGTVLPAMSTRKNGKPVLLREVLWAGAEPIDAYEFFFSSLGRRYRLVSPKACANFWVEDFGKEGRPMLAVQCSAPAEIVLRRPVEVCLVVTNTGDGPEPLTTVRLPMPPGATLTSTTAFGQGSNGEVVWNVTNLTVEGSARLCAEFSCNTPTNLTFNPTVTGRVATPAQSSCTTAIIGIPAILLEVMDLDDPIEVGKELTYEIRVTNQGSAAVTNVKIKCTLADAQEYVAGNGQTLVYANDRAIQMAPLPVLNPKDRATWRVVVKALAAGDVRFSMVLNCDQFQKPLHEEEATRQY